MICTGRILRDAPFLMEFYLETGPLLTAGNRGMTERAGRGKRRKKVYTQRFPGGEILLEFYLVI